jgi:cold-inducible RNA-binding protein
MSDPGMALIIQSRLLESDAWAFAIDRADPSVVPDAFTEWVGPVSASASQIRDHRGRNSPIRTFSSLKKTTEPYRLHGTEPRDGLGSGSSPGRTCGKFAPGSRGGFPRDSVESLLQASVMAKRLYVGNLKYTVDSDQLRELFEQFGSVSSAEVLSDRDTGRSRGFGFVEMPNDEEAQAAIETLDGRDHDGRRLTVNEARPRTTGGGGGGGGGYRGPGGYRGGGGGGGYGNDY